MAAPKYRYGEYRKNEGVIPQGHGIYSQSATAMAALGDRVVFADGRVFRYAKAGAVALAPGKFVKSGDITHANAIDDLTGIVATGSYELTLVTSSAVTTAEEGYLQINDEAGEGIQYKIKSCKANATTATSTDLELYDPIATALTAASQGTIVYNPYKGLVICSAITDQVVGVPPIAVTAEYYFWLQTWGPACVYSEGVPAAGTKVQVSVNSNPAGTTTCASDTSMPVGIQMAVGVNGEHKPVWLMLAP